MKNNKFIPHSRPLLGTAEVSAAMRVIKSGLLAQGEQVRALERAAARFVGVRYGIAASSGTAALYLGLKALGVSPGQEVIIPSYVCAALWQAVKFCGAQPVLADSDPATFNLDADSVKAALSAKTAAIIAPHMFGLPLDVRELKRFGVPVMEDCAQALGAKIAGRSVGSFGEAAVLSFYATKLLAAGEGGLLLSKNAAVSRRALSLREYDEQPLGEPRLNFKLTDLQAAIARVQLGRLRGFIAKRAAVAALYDKNLRDLGVGLPLKVPGRVYQRYVVSLPKGCDAGNFELRMRKLGVGARRPVFR
nr:aminotransferase class I/II-fold pyridoxal phosphate-dependent enzyme [Elusimicrobiales bacterium]